MSLTLHAATVPNWLQILGSAKGWLDKAEGQDGILGAKLADDMWPFAKQIAVLATHSQGAIEGVRKGVFTPEFGPAPTTIVELRAKIDGAIAFLEGLTVEEMQAFVGQPMRFEIGEKKLPFLAEDFLLTFSQTNFFFHAVTAYGILRANGIAVGKLDYLGKLRMALPA
ncbi:MAG: hypothetical protein B7Z08_09985 [Sphingomonadales bacterium 32-68-7]|nr:MAG: hypothetical protein B7Z33_06215 [Sphingomonadales bacterium 12-68-11]OYX08320.1 MAG: hypothetical protein B7Z08_09985 [Sphingomonadales bacterium 32-68-7]